MAAVPDHGANELARFAARLRASSEIVVAGRDLLVPVLLDGEGPDADLLEEGVAAGTTTLREVDEDGEVGKVLVRHSGKRLLLLLDGDLLVGAKQNRVVNASFLVPPGAEIEIPVSCVERGRWAHRARGPARRFEASDVTLTGIARRRKLGRVTDSIVSGCGYEANQAAVWHDVDEYLSQSRVVSATSALADGYEARREDVDAKLAGLRPLPRQAGLALVRGGRLSLCDLFGSTALYRRGWRKIAAGMLGDEEATGSTSPDEALRLVSTALAHLRGVDPVRRAAPGHGETLHGSEAGFHFGAISAERRIYHALIGS